MNQLKTFLRRARMPFVLSCLALGALALVVGILSFLFHVFGLWALFIIVFIWAFSLFYLDTK